MAKAYLRAKAELVLDGEPYVVERQCSDGIWVLRHKRTERPIERTTAQLFDAYAAGTVKFLVKDLANISSKSRRAPDQLAAAAADDSEIRAAKLRMAYVRAIAGLPCTKATLEQAIQEVWTSLPPASCKKPGWVSVYRWARAYTDSDKAPAALVAANSRKGNRTQRFQPEVIALCEDVIESDYLKLERPNLEHVVNLAKAKTRAANRTAPQAGQLAFPTRKLIRRLIAEIPAYDKYVARYGREAARKKFRTALRHRLTDGPLQRAEMDHTRMDIFVVDETHGLPLGRPWLTVLVDDYTRCILGFCLSFEPPSRATVARCLRHAFMPKTLIRSQYPDLKNDWTAFGVMAELVLDGGSEFHSAELENICFELDVEQHFSPRKTPWFKGKVERLQGTLNRGVAVTTPGKTFEGILDRDDYDPKKHAVVTMSQLLHVVYRWIVDVYHQKTHSALGCSPEQKWTNSILPHDIPLMADPLRFDAIVGGNESRVLSHKGIEYAGLIYNSPDMGELRRHLGDRLTVNVRLDRSNLGSVIVLHPERGTPYRVPCLRPDYAEGLTEWQHNVCRRYTRGKHEANGDVDAWLDSLLEISDIVHKEMKLGKRKGVTRERIARWSEGKQTTVGQIVDTAPPVVTNETATPVSLNAALTSPDSAGPSIGTPSITRKRFAPVFEERMQVPLAEEIPTVETTHA